MAEHHPHRHHSAQYKHNSPCVMHLLLAHFLADPLSQLHCPSCAQKVAQQCPHIHHEQVVRSRQCDCGNLRSVPPFGQECHDESLSQDCAVRNYQSFLFLARSHFVVELNSLFLLRPADQFLFHFLNLLFDLNSHQMVTSLSSSFSPSSSSAVYAS